MRTSQIFWSKTRRLDQMSEREAKKDHVRRMGGNMKISSLRRKVKVTLPKLTIQEKE